MALTAAALAERFAVQDTEFTFDVRGETLKARVLASAADVLDVEREVAATQKMLAKSPAPHLAPYRDTPGDVVRSAVWCKRLMLDPPMTLADALLIGQTCGMLLLEIASAVMSRAGADTQEAENEAVEEAKNS